MGKRQEAQPLRFDLAARLEPRLQTALSHSLRREILRALDGGGRFRSVGEFLPELVPCTRGAVAYHLRVLCSVGAIVGDGDSEATANGQPAYKSLVAEDAGVRAALRATEQWDLERRRGEMEETASPLLTMFRLPRAVRTIRLKARDQSPR